MTQRFNDWRVTASESSPPFFLVMGMAIGRGKPNAGQGGRLGRSNMAYWGTNDEEKEHGRKRRRRADRDAVAEGKADGANPDRVTRRRVRRRP